LRILQGTSMSMQRILAFVSLMIVILSACSMIPLDETQPQMNSAPSTIVPVVADQSTTVTFATYRADEKFYRSLIDLFDAQNPNIQVQLVMLDNDVDDAIVNQEDGIDGQLRSIVSAADTAAIPTTWLSTVYNVDRYLFNLKSFIDAEPAFAVEDFYPGALLTDPQTHAIYGVSRAIHQPLLFYNQNLWLEQGLSPPQPDWTWNTIFDSATQLARKTDNRVQVYGFLGQWGSALEPLSVTFDTAGVHLTAPTGDQALDSPDAVAALNQVADLVKDGAVYLRPPTSTLGIDISEFESLVQEQRVAMWSADMTSATSFPFAVGAASLPASALQSPDPTESFIMSSGTQQSAAAWRWLTFLSQNVGLPTGYTGVNRAKIVPARQSIAERDRYWETLPTETGIPDIVEMSQAMLITRTTNVAPHWPTLNALIEALTNVVYNGQTAEQALQGAQSGLDAQIAEERQAPTPTPDTAPIVVATPIPEPVLTDTATITFIGRGFDSEQLRLIAERFNAENRDVSVQIVDTQSQTRPSRLEEVAASADCFSWYGAPQESERRLLMDLQPFVDTDSTIATNDYPAGFLRFFQHEGRLYGLPQALFFRVLAYNPQIFDSANLAHPDSQWRVDDLLAAAEQLTQESGTARQYGFASLLPPGQDIAFLLEQRGATAARIDGEDVELMFTEPNVLETLQTYLRLIRTTSPQTAMLEHMQNMSADVFEAVSEGRVAMWFDSGMNTRELADQTGQTGDIAIAPPPLAAGMVGLETMLMRGLYISAEARDPQTCWTWLKYLSADVSSLKSAFPARRSVVQSDAFLAQALPGSVEVYQAYSEAFERTPDVPPSLPEGSRIDYYWFYHAIDRALQGEDLERELQAAQQLTEQYLACVQAGGAGAACATQVDPAYAGGQQEGPGP
jgi:ABC-type glycerol-3-phosphate transport system substrate-binding protein